MVIEAMAMAVPVVATEVGGPAEILARGGGLLAPPRSVPAWAAAIERLLDEPAARARMGEAGRKHATERYGLERFVARVLDGYAVARRGR